jgi:hypothetical protein
MKGKQDISHPLFGTSITNWFHILIDNGGVDKGYLLRAFFNTCITVITLPSRLISKFVYDKKIAKTPISYPPIFIIGHWRSGTTFLHELMSQDPCLAYVSVWNTLVPYNFLALENIKRGLAKFLPATRPMDMIKVDMDSPYEDDAGLAVLGHLSFFHCIHFPRNAEKQFRQSVLFEGLNEKKIEAWKKNYLYLLKSVTYENHGKQLVLKNPANTARIKKLLEMFPDARFIHICRNPYTVYFSTKKMRMRVLDIYALQKTTTEEIDQHVINDYIRLMKRYFEDKDKIPKGQLVEIRYEDIVADPLSNMKKIYTKLGLSGFKEAKIAMQIYLEKQADYVKNVHKPDEDTIRKIDEHWGFTIKRWGYELPYR